jgi:hypothetical protein
MYTIICHMYPFCLKMRDTTLTVLDSWCIGRYRSPCSHSYVRHLYGRQNGRQRTDVGREIKFDLRASLSFTRSERTAGAGEGVRGIADVSDVGSKLTAKQVQRPTSLSPQRKTPIRPLTVLSRATNCVYDLVVDRSHRVAAVNSTTDGWPAKLFRVEAPLYSHIDLARRRPWRRFITRAVKAEIEPLSPQYRGRENSHFTVKRFDFSVAFRQIYYTAFLIKECWSRFWCLWRKFYIS